MRTTLIIAPDKPVHWRRVGGQRKLTFTFDKLRIRLGPKWLEFPLQVGQLGTTCAPFQTLLTATGMSMSACRYFTLLGINVRVTFLIPPKSVLPTGEGVWRATLICRELLEQGKHRRQEIAVFPVHLRG